MQELRTNFQNKYGQTIPLPKIYQDEDSSDSKGLELADSTTVGKKTTGGTGSSSGGKPRKSPQPVAVLVQVVAAVPVQVVAVA